MAFYGIGNLFGNLVRPDTREKEQAREAEEKKAEQEKAAKSEDAAKGQQAREAETASQAEAQRQRLLQLQEKVARRLEDFVRASGREKSQSADSDTESLLRQMENEQDSFTPENLQRLRQLSQSTKGVLQASREGQSESQARQDTGRPEAGRPQPGTSQDQELLMRRAAQELKNQLQHTEAQTTGRAQQEARETGRDTATDTRSQKAQEARSQSTAPESGAARAEKPVPTPAQPEQAKAQAPKPEAARPEQAKAQTPKPEAAKPEQAQAPKPEAARPEQAKAQAPKPEAARPEQAKAQAPKPEAARPEQAQAPKPEAARPEQAQAPKPEAARPEQAKAQTPKPEAARPEQAQAPKPEAAKPEQTRGQTPGPEEAPAREAGGKNQSEPAAPRPETMRARPQSAGKQASEARTESKAPEGKPAEGQESASRTQGPGTPARFATSQRPGAEARLPGQGPAQPEEANRPEAARRAAPQAGTEPTRSKDATPEGPRTARGQETAGGAGVSTGGTTQEKSQARLGDSRFAPHMDPENPAQGKPSDQANRTPQGNQGKEQVGQAGKNAPGTSPQPEGKLSGQGLGSIRGGSSGPIPGRPFGSQSGATRSGDQAHQPAPQKTSPDPSQANKPPQASTPKPEGGVSTLGLGSIRPGLPEADFNRPLAGPSPGSREADPPARQTAPPPPEPQDTLEISLPPRASRGGGLPGHPGSIGAPGASGAARVPTSPRVVAEQPTAGTGNPPPPAEPEAQGMGLQSIPAIGASPRPLPGLTPRPVGGPLAPDPQSPVAPDRMPAQLRRGQIQPEMIPGASNPNVPRPVHLGAIRLPAPDGRDDSGNRKSEPTDDFGIESVDTIGRGAPPRLTPRPGLHLPVRGPQGPRPERGPVGRVEGWLPEDGPTDSSTRGGPRGAGPSASDPGIEMGGLSLPRVSTPRPPALPLFQKPEFLDLKAPRADHVHPSAPQDGLVMDDPLHPAPTHLKFKTLEGSPFRSPNQTVPETPRPERPFRPFSPLPKGDWGASRQEAVGPAAPGTGPTLPGAPAQRPAPGQTSPHIEILRPRSGGIQGRLLPGFGMNPDQGLVGPNLRPGPSPLATDPSGEAFQVQMAGRILSGESHFVASTAGFAGRTAGPAIPAEVGATIASATRQDGRTDPVGQMRAGLPRGPLTGGRPVVSQIPIYQPVLDLIYQIRGKAKVEQESSPIKMTLSGSVGTLERQAYVPREAPSALPGPQAAASRQTPTGAEVRPQTQHFQPAQRETAEPAQRRVHTASEQNPLLGTMTASLRGPAQPVRRESAAATRVEGAHAKAETSSQRVVETGDAPGRGGGGGTAGGERGSGGQGGQGQSEGGPPGSLSEMQSRFRVQTLRASATHEAFRISMTRMQNPVGARHSEMATRYATTSIPTLLKRIYRSQDLEGLDEAEAVNSLALMLKLSGEFTYDHSARVLDFAMELADELGIEDREIRHQVGLGAMFKDIGEAGLLLAQQPDEQIDEISRFMSSQDMRRASLLHDIGKIQIPRDILCKPGRMTDEEYQLMRMHPIYGEQMIYPILSLRHLCPTIRGHHERWDGKGYPDGLKGEQIPLPARILAVADVFDALHAERPYKSSMEVDQVRKLLSEGKGTHFDPECVEAFLRVLDRRFPQAGRRRPQRVRAR